MQQNTTSVHGMWSSKLGFILAASGSAVGLGNIWRFPSLVSENGGSAFVLVYLGCILIIGLPIMVAEIMMGRAGRLSPVGTMRELAKNAAGGQFWQWIGWSGTAASVMILGFYSVVAGWTLSYSWQYFMGLFGEGAAIADGGATFNGLLGDWKTLLLWHSVFMGMTMLVVAGGVQSGIERASKILMPLLVLLLLALVGYGMTTAHFGEAVSYLFSADFSKINADSLLEALGQAFFSLSLGLGSLMVYGAYLGNKDSVGFVSGAVAISDTLIALLAGLAIFPLVFAFGLDKTVSGAGLIFAVLPAGFADMTGGNFWGFLFFLLLSVAAWTSAISLLEPSTALLSERTSMGRKGAALTMTVGIWVLGVAVALGLNVWKDFTIVADKNIMDSLDYITANILLPVGGIGVALFAGWAMDKNVVREHLSDMPDWLYGVWKFMAMVVAPALTAWVLYGKLAGGG